MVLRQMSDSYGILRTLSEPPDLSYTLTYATIHDRCQNTALERVNLYARRPDQRARRARAQPEEHRRRYSARQAGGNHRPLRLRQIDTGLRYDLRRGSAPLCRVAFGLRAAVSGPAEQA